jgi:hypothetical protein
MVSAPGCCANTPIGSDLIPPSPSTTTERDRGIGSVSAVGSRYGDILPAEGHLFDLLEPEDVVPAWKRWSPILLRPEGLYGTRPAERGNKAAKLKAIREAQRKVKRVWLATDCDREGQLISQPAIGFRGCSWGPDLMCSSGAVRFVHDSPLEGDGFELSLKIDLRKTAVFGASPSAQ